MIKDSTLRAAFQNYLAVTSLKQGRKGCRAPHHAWLTIQGGSIVRLYHSPAVPHGHAHSRAYTTSTAAMVDKLNEFAKEHQERNRPAPRTETIVQSNTLTGLNAETRKFEVVTMVIDRSTMQPTAVAMTHHVGEKKLIEALEAAARQGYSTLVFEITGGCSKPIKFSVKEELVPRKVYTFG